MRSLLIGLPFLSLVLSLVAVADERAPWQNDRVVDSDSQVNVCVNRTDDEEELKLAPPERLKLMTTDGVELHAVWYAGGVRRIAKEYRKKIDYKQVVPIIIVHGWNQSSDSFAELASFLQRLGHAVIVPDLRGHGRSSKVLREGRELEPDDFTKTEIEDIALFDLVRVKKFLLEKNNSKELNIELLCVIGSEEGSHVAANWVSQDWRLVDLPNRKRGKDVKGIIFLSPMVAHKRHHLNDTMKQPVFSGQDPAVFTIPVLIIVGEDDRKAYSNAWSIHRRLDVSRKRLHSLLANEDEPHERQTLFYLVARDTELRGHRLLDHPRLWFMLHYQIKGFIDDKLILKSSADFSKWTDRSVDPRP